MSSVRMLVRIEALFVDARFVFRQGLPATPLQRATAIPGRGWEGLRRKVLGVRQDALYERYVRLHQLHYGPEGRGYSGLAPATLEEQMRRYRGQVSRLEFFVSTYPNLLQFRDGDTFLDLGCGTGQNIRMLAERYPSSHIVGYDVNSDAVMLIRKCEPNPGVMVDVGDLTNDAWRKEALADGFDHIVMSHVFSLVFERSLTETVALRRRIISDLTDACRSSLIIVDNFGLPGPPRITIEQRHRATLSDDVLGYFADINGGLAYLVQSDRSRAVVFVKDSARKEQLA